MATSIGNEAGQHTGDQSGFHLIHEGPQALVARAVLIDETSVSVDLQYYIFSDDTSGRILTDKLLQAADRGVRVRLLVDDLGTRLNNPWVTPLDNHPNIEVRVFNPVEGQSRIRRGLEQLLNLGRINHRMHNKLLIADGIAMITGGRNISDGYFTSADVEFLDVDTIAIGAILPEAAKTFDEYWNHQVSVPASELVLENEDAHTLTELRDRLQQRLHEEEASEFFQAVKDSSLAQDLAQGKVSFEWGKATLLADPPDKAAEPDRIPITEYPGYQLEQIVRKLQQRLQISNAYVIPGEPGMNLFTELEKRGVQVDVLTNGLSSTDTAAAHGGYSRYRKPLLRAGVRLWELRPAAEREHRMHWFKDKSRATLHAKTFVMDSDRGFVGSINLDSRSIILNTEIGVLIENREINRQLQELFQTWTAPDSAWRLELDSEGDIRWRRTDDDGEEIVKDKDPNSTLWQRFLTGILAYLPIESQI
ncbi:phospholipase D family protein [Microbulbifer marinus]|uniref:phospholipase D family protein n=1 Tax=Microbulbifer marinus TaxID=658218 RepID=UPI001FCDA42C|nr:phospholipase D family protein [Microbulbifer marinus]